MTTWEQGKHETMDWVAFCEGMARGSMDKSIEKGGNILTSALHLLTAIVYSLLGLLALEMWKLEQEVQE